MDEPAGYLDLLRAGDSGAIRSRFAGEPDIDDPRAGRIQGDQQLEQFVLESAVWLRERSASIEPVAITRDHRREISEWLLHLQLERGPWALPVAVVSDVTARGIAAIRVYHSMWPVIGAHVIRPPLLPPNRTMVLGGAVAGYQRALALGHLDGILNAYEPNAVVREPSGGPYSFTGSEEIRRIYTLMFANGGGIPLQHCTATDDSVSCALEYNAVRWGDTPLAPQAGIAVYVRGASGRLAAARIYDDVEPPAVSNSATNT